MDTTSLAEQVGQVLLQQKLMLVTAESCTGGGVAYAVTSVSGSSQWFDRGFVTYTNHSKQQLLGVRTDTLAQYGAVSEATVREMAEGALQRSEAQVALSISGIAGPGGATLDKPVGTVCFGWAVADQPVWSCIEHFRGNRQQVREQAIQRALQGVLDGLL